MIWWGYPHFRKAPYIPNGYSTIGTRRNNQWIFTFAVGIYLWSFLALVGLVTIYNYIVKSQPRHLGRYRNIQHSNQARWSRVCPVIFPWYSWLNCYNSLPEDWCSRLVLSYRRRWFPKPPIPSIQWWKTVMSQHNSSGVGFYVPMFHITQPVGI